MAFFAVQPPEAVRFELGSQIQRLGERYQGVDWEDWRDLHITLKFFAGWSRDSLLAQIEPWTMALTQLNIQPFKLKLSAFGSFRKRSAPGVLWLQADGGNELINLATEFDQLMYKASGINRERRPYHPHLTLGRVTEPALFSWQDWDNEAALSSSFMADSILLMKRRSREKNQSPKFEVLTTWAI